MKEVVKLAADLLDNSDGTASEIIKHKAFPSQPPGIAEGRNVQWTTESLLTNPKYPHQLSTPKPDYHCGYPLSRKLNWAGGEMAAINH